MQHHEEGHPDEDIDELKRQAEADIAAADSASSEKKSTEEVAEKEAPPTPPRSEPETEDTASQAAQLKNAKSEHWRGML